MPPLDGAFALAQMNHVAVTGRPAPGSRCGAARPPAFRDRLRRCETRAAASLDASRMRGFQILLAIHAAHAFAAAARRGFEQHRIAQRLRGRSGLLRIDADRGFGARNHRRSGRDRDLPRRGFRAHLSDGLRGRADEHDAGRRARLRRTRRSRSGIRSRDGSLRRHGVRAASMILSIRR